MAYNAALTALIRKSLSHRDDVEEKKMFRGVAFMVDGKLCISAGDHEIMCRIDPALHDEALQREGVRTVVMKGRPYKGYVYVHEDVIRNKEDRDYWIGLALAYNKVAKASGKKKK